jgi:hypothetical protein
LAHWPWAKAAVPALLAAQERQEPAQLIEDWPRIAVAQIDPAAALPAFQHALDKRNDAIPYELAKIDHVDAIKILWSAQGDRKTREPAECNRRPGHPIFECPAGPARIVS